MSNISAPSGLRLALSPSGQSRANVYQIASAYGTLISYGDPVVLNTNGTITAVTATSDAILGVFAGCEYIDASGKPVESKNWPASTATLAGTAINAYVYDDPFNLYDIQVTGNASSYTQAAIGDQINLHPVTAGNTATGQSNASAAAALLGAAQGQVRIMALTDGVYDASNNAYPVIRVQIARHPFLAAAVGI